MIISIFGIGYVGTISAACLCQDGHTVVAVDPNNQKTRLINEVLSPLVEEGADRLIKQAVAENKLTACNDPDAAIMRTDLSFVCVGTPNLPSGNIDLTQVKQTAEQIGKALRKKKEFHSVVIRSTVLPGSTENTIIPLIEKNSGKRNGVDFGVAFYPQFLREGSAIEDYCNPALTIIGKVDDETVHRLQKINKNLECPEIIIDIRTAEIVKYTNNAWHALKISFANETGNICNSLGIDGHKVLEILCADTRLNISKAYLMPGFAFGGSCLPKDLETLRYRASQLVVPTPVLDEIRLANNVKIDNALKMVARTRSQRIGMLGLSFKPGTDDLRESPLVELAERLHGKGYDLRIYDPGIHLSRLMGLNGDDFERNFSHLAKLIVPEVELLYEHSDVLIIGHNGKLSEDVVERAGDRQIIDLVRSDLTKMRRSGNNYQGICW